MVLTASTAAALGSPLPLALLQQELVPVHGGPLPTTLAGRPLLLLFLCPHCPFVKHIEPELSRLEADLGAQLQLLAVCSNSTRTHPQDGPAGMAEQAQRCGWSFPYLADPRQTVAKALAAACTPDLYLYDQQLQLYYRGQLDGSRPGNALPCDGADLRQAIDHLLAGDPPPQEVQASIGCNIKWHPGEEPAWFGA